MNVTAVALGALSLLGVLGYGAAMMLGAQEVTFLLVLSGVDVLFCALAYWLGRRGWVTLAGYALALVVWAGATLAMALGAWESTAATGYLLSLVIATVLCDWMGGLIFCAVSVASYWVLGWLFSIDRLLNLVPVVTLEMNVLGLGSALVAISVLVYLSVHRLGMATFRQLRETRDYAAELERTALEREELLSRLQERVERQETLLEMSHHLSMPVLPLFQGLIVMPLAGYLDVLRAERLLGDVLDGIAAHSASHVLLDVTGVLDIEPGAAQGLLKAIQGARLAGSEPALVGVQPVLARELVLLGVDLTKVATYGTLREGVAEIRGQYSVARPTA